MSRHYALDFHGTTLWLLPEKAIYWPEQRALLIADAHFGKAAAYRRLGQPVPHGTTANNLAVLDTLLARHDCQQLIFLGDFLHAPGSQGPATLAALQQWRDRHPTLAITLIRGNHDHRAGDPPATLRFAVVAEPWVLGPFALQHEPAAHGVLPVLAGHVHPVYRLHGKGRQSLRLPCFMFGGAISLLPAFGAFTGGHAVRPDRNDNIYVIGDGQVWPIATGR